MDHPVPPQVVVALEQLQKAAQSVEKREVDFVKTPWAELEPTVIKLLGGPFQLESPEHQVVALGLAAAFAERLIAEHQAFWFFDRDAPEGASLGFPTALIMLSPFGAAVDALSRAKLPNLETVQTDIRRALAQARFAPGQAAPPRLAPDDYQRLFDAGFVQFLSVDLGKAKEAWDATPAKLRNDIRDAISRSSRIPKEARPQLEGQLTGALDRLDPSAKLIDQVPRLPRVGELMIHLFGTRDATGFAPEELWQDIVLPLLFIGAPDRFPPLEEQELQAWREGADALALFVDLVPYQAKAAEEGLLGVFPVTDLGLAHDAFKAAPGARLIKVGRGALEAGLRGFDAARTKDAVTRFVTYVEEKAGFKRGAAEVSPLLDASLQLLGDLKRAALDPKNQATDLFMRRCTEAEAASEAALTLVRDALSAPRIILA